jgi:hypothetical protein
VPPVVRALYRAHMGGRVRAVDAYDLFVRCVRAFNPKNSDSSKIQIKDQAANIAAVRFWLETELAKKKAPTSGAKEVKSRTDYILRRAV